MTFKTRLSSFLFLSVMLASTAVSAGEMPTKIFRSKSVKLDDPDAMHLQRGFLFLKREALEEASIEFKACKNIFVADDYAIVVIGKMFERSGEFSTAISVLTKLIDYSKTAPRPVADRVLGQAFKYRADAYSDQHKWTEAFLDYKKAATVDPTEAGYDYRMAALSCTKQKKFDEALKLFDLSAAAGSDVPQYHYQKGQCLEELKRYSEAITEFDKTLQELEIVRKKSPERLTALLRRTLIDREHCHLALGQKAAAAADRKQLNEFAQGWEEDLFGGAAGEIPHK